MGHSGGWIRTSDLQVMGLAGTAGLPYPATESLPLLLTRRNHSLRHLLLFVEVHSPLEVVH